MTGRARFALGLAMILSAGAVTAYESTERADPESSAAADLCGRWLLTMPAGFEFDATLELSGEDGRYRLHSKATNLNGVYELRDRRLTVVTPDNEQMAGLAWEVKNRNVLLLTGQPQPSAVGSDYRNATLSRQKSADERTPRRADRRRRPGDSPED